MECAVVAGLSSMEENLMLRSVLSILKLDLSLKDEQLDFLMQTSVASRDQRIDEYERSEQSLKDELVRGGSVASLASTLSSRKTKQRLTSCGN